MKTKKKIRVHSISKNNTLDIVNTPPPNPSFLATKRVKKRGGSSLSNS